MIKSMETKSKKSSQKSKEQITEQKPKSAFTLFWEKYPNGYAGGCKVMNEEAVLR